MFNLTRDQADTAMQWYPWLSTSLTTQLDKRLAKKLARETVPTISAGEIVLLYNWFNNVPPGYVDDIDNDLIDELIKHI